VVIENFRAGAAERLGLDYESVRRLREDVVYCSITGFGSGRQPTGRPGYDFVVQAECGLMSVTGDPPGPPMKVGVAVVDVLCGLHAAAGILAALRERDGNGTRPPRGRRLEVSLLESGLAALVNVAQAALSTGIEAARYGSAHPSIVPYEPFEAADGWIAIAAPNDGLWLRLCEAIERPDLAADERLSTNPGRVRHREELVRSLSSTLRTRPAAEWLARLDQHGVPAGKVRGVREAFEAAAEAGEPATIEVDHATIGRLPLTRSPIRLDPEDQRSPLAPPVLGQHTEEILRELGL
jgi:crotonobetainyl-CoA:carnitine CoA-transferase CaiB-like acyl-CoA transferase